MLLSGNESKAIAHFQQVTGDVLNQLFFYVPFVCLFLSSSQVKDVRVFQKVIGKVALRCRKRGCEIVYLIIADLSAIQIGFNFYFRFLSVRLNRLKNKLLANYLRNRGNDLATVRNSAFCVAILSNNSFICKYNIFFRKYELSVAIL